MIRLFAIATALSFGCFTSVFAAQPASNFKEQLPVGKAFETIFREVEAYMSPPPYGWFNVKGLGLTDSAQMEKALRECCNLASEYDMHLLSPAEKLERDARLAGGYSDLGITFSPGLKWVTGGLKVTHITTNGSDLRVGDQIYAINDHVLANCTSSEIVEYLDRGRPGTEVSLSIFRGSTPGRIRAVFDAEYSLGFKFVFLGGRYAWVVEAVRPGSIAAENGIQRGDLLSDIAGLSPETDDPSGVSPLRYMRNLAAGGSITLSFVRQHSAFSREMKVDIASKPELRLHGEGRAWENGEKRFYYLHLPNLDWQDLIRSLDVEMDRMRYYPGLVLDLRHSQGIDLKIVEQVINRLGGSSGPIIVGRTSRLEEVCIEGRPTENHFRGRIAVLVDSSTSGTAEVLAAYLKSAKAPIVGREETAGKTNLPVVLDYLLRDGKSISVSLNVFRVKTLDGSQLARVEPTLRILDDTVQPSSEDRCVSHAANAITEWKIVERDPLERLQEIVAQVILFIAPSLLQVGITALGVWLFFALSRF